ncbi:MAG TPA: hypothetical protein DIT13_09775 [Verrucomicrobiales bacterium]|nr:hypothetical protein [Verrucomicrobiales bacterium]HRJ07325.1 hypothetical protein [Prosthecobacter sp.]HRK15428.1 hypothetical protein [Prosthecobacter sp.]
MNTENDLPEDDFIETAFQELADAAAFEAAALQEARAIYTPERVRDLLAQARLTAVQQPRLDQTRQTAESRAANMSVLALAASAGEPLTELKKSLETDGF